MAAFITITGNLGKDIEEFSFGNDGKGVRFSIAVTDTIRGEDTTNWYAVACFGRVAQAAQEHMQAGRLTKGSQVLVMGSFKPRDYTTKNGDERKSMDVTASSLEILRWPDNRQSQQQGDQYEPEEDDSLNGVPF